MQTRVGCIGSNGSCYTTSCRNLNSLLLCIKLYTCPTKKADFWREKNTQKLTAFLFTLSSFVAYFYRYYVQGLFFFGIILSFRTLHYTTTITYVKSKRQGCSITFFFFHSVLSLNDRKLYHIENICQPFAQGYDILLKIQQQYDTQSTQGCRIPSVITGHPVSIDTGC